MIGLTLILPFDGSSLRLLLDLRLLQFIGNVISWFSLIFFRVNFVTSLKLSKLQLEG